MLGVGHVPRSEDPGVAGPQPGVDEDPVVHGQPRLPGKLVVGNGPHADEHGVGVDAGAVAQHGGAVRQPVETGLETQVDASGAVHVGEAACGLGTQGGQQRLLGRFDHGDRGAERERGGSCLHPDPAATEHEEVVEGAQALPQCR